MILLSNGIQAQENFNLLTGEKKTCVVNDQYSFIYQFDQRPKMGTRILKIKLTHAPSAKDTSFQITGQSDMPSMHGAHDSGEILFKRNKKGEYLLPVTFVMPGKWEIKLRFKQNGQIINRSRIEVDV